MKFLKILPLLLLLSACTAGFEEINTNPNEPENVDPQFLLTHILYNTANNSAMDAWNAGNFLGQHTARFDFNEVDRWDIRTNAELWNKSYLLLKDVQTLYNQSEGVNPHYQAMALVMRAYLTATITDLWADVPYSEALKGASEANFTPAYDTQEDIYTGPEGVLESLREAENLFQNNPNALPVQGDIMFAGDIDKWTRFANSLRLRYLLRISDKISVSTEMNAIVAGGLIFQENGDNAVVPYLSTAPNQWFVHTIREGDYANVRMSLTMDSILHQLDDPRMMTWFKPAVAAPVTAPYYAGIPNGLGPDSRTNYDLAQVSTLGEIFRDQPNGIDAQLMTYPELQFVLAEAANAGLVSGNGQTYYEMGIQAAFAYWQTALPADYLTRTDVAWDGSQSKIILQKWLCNFNNAYEGWIDYRRTGFPVLKTAVDNVNNDQFPVRYRYPDSEQAVNSSNYGAAAARIGGDTYNSTGWWEN